MNLIYDDFPETVCIDGKEYEVITDFREWVRFADTAAADELTEEEKLCIFRKRISIKQIHWSQRKIRVK